MLDSPDTHSTTTSTTSSNGVTGDATASRFEENLKVIDNDEIRSLLTRIQRGIEKEGLRVTADGQLAQTPHPTTLGSALTNPWLTTDFSESLLEFITPVFESIPAAMGYLNDIHALTYQKLDNEIIWGTSMPCILPDDDQIPLAQYGSSNIAKMKTVYRRGLGLRYGRAMQTVAGIHYNFSLPEAFWRRSYEYDRCNGRTELTHLQSYIDERYLSLIRNFRRHYWLLIYLFGAAPCVDKSFVHGRPHSLSELGSKDYYYANATSLRMGDLGYQSSAQKSLFVCYNTLENYIETLGKAIKTPYSDYETMGLKHNGEYQQLSTALLQIENEFYSPIRPKRVTHSGETPLRALAQRGIEYVEVRCLDINPMLACGIDETTIRFIDSFLLFCLLDESPLCDREEFDRISENQSRVVNNGRDAALKVFCGKTEVPLKDCANRLLGNIEAIARHLDLAHRDTASQQSTYLDSIKAQQAKVQDSQLTPSAQVLDAMASSQLSHIDYSLQQSLAHRASHQSHTIDPEQQQKLLALAAESLGQQRKIEQDSSEDFDAFLSAYYQQ